MNKVKNLMSDVLLLDKKTGISSIEWMGKISGFFLVVMHETFE